MRLARVAPVLGLVIYQMFSAAPAEANGCSGTAPVNTQCVVPHNPWTWAEPKPTISWGLGFTGAIEARVVGVYGATTIKVCNVVAGTGQCTTPRNDHMQCCTEHWVLLCSVGGVGSWTCGHTGG